MDLILAFFPFVAFTIINRLCTPLVALVVGAVLAAALLIRDELLRRQLKVFMVGTAVLFSGLAVYSMLETVAWSVVGVRLCVDIGLLVIVLLSLAIRRPFTLQYAHEQVPEESWITRQMVRANYIITAVWAATFAMLVVADVVMLFIPHVPLGVGIWATILALLAAFRFAGWYPKRAANC